MQLVPQLKGFSPVGGGQKKKIDISNMDSQAYDEYLGGRVAPSEASGELVLDLTNPGHQIVKALFEAGAQGTIGNIQCYVGQAGNTLAPTVGGGNLLFPPVTAGSGLAAPVQSSLATATSGGTLAAGTYYYVVTALNANGETVASNEKNIVTTGATSTVTVSWSAVTGATGYNIYRSNATGTETFLISVGAVVTYTDTGSGTPTSVLPPANNTTGTWARSGMLANCYVASLTPKAADNDVWRADFKLQVTGATNWQVIGQGCGKQY